MKRLYSIDSNNSVHNVNSTLPVTDSVVFVPCIPGPMGVYFVHNSIL